MTGKQENYSLYVGIDISAKYPSKSFSVIQLEDRMWSKLPKVIANEVYIFTFRIRQRTTDGTIQRS